MFVRRLPVISGSVLCDDYTHLSRMIVMTHYLLLPELLPGERSIMLIIATRDQQILAETEVSSSFAALDFLETYDF